MGSKVKEKEECDSLSFHFIEQLRSNEILQFLLDTIFRTLFISRTLRGNRISEKFIGLISNTQSLLENIRTTTDPFEPLVGWDALLKRSEDPKLIIAKSAGQLFQTPMFGERD